MLDALFSLSINNILIIISLLRIHYSSLVPENMYKSSVKL